MSKVVIALTLVLSACTSFGVMHGMGVRMSPTNNKPRDKWYVCLEALETNSVISIAPQGALCPAINYSRDGISKWSSLMYHTSTFYNPVVLSNIGDRVYLRSFRPNYIYPRQFFYKSRYVHLEISGKVAASGDATSLISRIPLNRLPIDGALGGAFAQCSGLVQAPDLPSKYITPHCYDFMFNKCTGLTNAPALPAKTVYEYSYRCMFQGCSKLESAGDIGAIGVYSYGCYAMFNSSGLRKPPAMPALTHIWDHGGYQMFARCSRLEYAPYINNCTVDNYGLYGMFLSCPLLAEVDTGMTSFNYTTNWLSDVSAEGTFRCPTVLKKQLDDGIIPRGPSTVPEGWTIEAND